MVNKRHKCVIRNSITNLTNTIFSVSFLLPYIPWDFWAAAHWCVSFHHFLPSIKFLIKIAGCYIMTTIFIKSIETAQKLFLQFLSAHRYWQKAVWKKVTVLVLMKQLLRKKHSSRLGWHLKRLCLCATSVGQFHRYIGEGRRARPKPLLKCTKSALMVLYSASPLSG